MLPSFRLGANALPQAARSLATRPVKQQPVKDLGKPKANTVVQRRRRFDPDANPFVANALGGGAMGAAENQVRKFAAEGGFENLPGEGEPLPARNVPPFMSREDAVLESVVEHLKDQKVTWDADDKAIYKKSALQDEMRDKLQNARGLKDKLS